MFSKMLDTCSIANDLRNRYQISKDKATSICTSFLKNFRQCPENTLMNLDTWRTLLWSQALGEQFRHDADKIYKKWLTQRYQHLALSKKLTILLKNLRKKYQIGIITNGTSSAQWEKIDMLNIRDLFDIILVSGDLVCEKPDRRIFWKACDELHVNPKHCLIVGDKLETDILGGVEAQLGGTVWVPLSRPFTLKQDDPVPDYVIHDVMELRWLLDDVADAEKGRFCPEDDCNSNGSDFS
ncbi:N-acylneuraminate-9-phosphatase isoform X2 [Sitophilus oryzae]|uniref:N-acylneuraminate-9-phosphatase isoform X2 n=1 Tax=Sitophilus oryzae TaxID=7048 RepID=A0A6J2YKM7_SITOR|nr:N-acylneuraminate-9-phosphatase isoform X2 [Sitophilus oryzae]